MRAPAPGPCDAKGGPGIHSPDLTPGPATLRAIGALALGAMLMLAAPPASADVAPEPTPSATPAPSTTPTDSSPADSAPEDSAPEDSTEPSFTPEAEPSPTPEPASPAPSPTPSPAPADEQLDGAAEESGELQERTSGVLAATAAPRIVFTDVSSRAGSSSYSKFHTEIAWLATSGVTTGWLQSDGTREFRPLSSISRDAMAAFLYRFAGRPAHDAPSRSPFTDIRSSSTSFYPEITWLARAGISKGWSTSEGSEFRPYSAITREAMAAFLYRFAGSPSVDAPRTSPFSDVSASSPFYDAIVWMAQTGASTGWRTSAGAEFRPKSTITRDAMAAFLYRLDRAGISYAPPSATAPFLRHSTVYVYGADVLNIRSGPSTRHEVVAQGTRGQALPATGTVSPEGWIEVTVDGARAWASGYYLVGQGGTAVTRAMTTYTNGHIPESDLCELSWDSSELLLCTAAEDFERLNAAFQARFGRTIPVNDSYRDYEAQVRAKALFGHLAATPGTSNHGWGAAVDIAGSTLAGGYSGEQYRWLRDQLAGYNWVLPTWARPGGSKPEAWHFEYTG